jgi:hypothetical protein
VRGAGSRAAGGPAATASVGVLLLLLAGLDLYFPSLLPFTLPRFLSAALLGVGPILIAGGAAAVWAARRAPRGPPVPFVEPSREPALAPALSEEAEPEAAGSMEEAIASPETAPTPAFPHPEIFPTPLADLPPIPSLEDATPAPAMAEPLSAPVSLAFSAAVRPELSMEHAPEPPPPTEMGGELMMEEEITRLRERVRELELTAATPETTPLTQVPPVAPPTAPRTSVARLSRVPSPPALFTGAPGTRLSCSGCGSLLGTDPTRGHVCWGCGRPLCSSCFWRASPSHAVHYCPGCVGRGVPEMSRSGGRAGASGLKQSGSGAGPVVPASGNAPGRSVPFVG